MQLSVAANYDPDLISQLAEYPVRDVYGKFPADLVGGGRPSYMGTPLSRRDLEHYILLLSRHGIAFNYLLNSSCQGNREWSHRWQRNLNKLLDRLAGLGVTSVTVATPFLLQAIKARFPQFRVKVSIYAQVDTARRARFWEDLGADTITLESFSINRDFPTLREIRAAVDCELQLIPNHCCLLNCPLQCYHQNGFAHSSTGSGPLFIDYCFLKCSRARLRDPSQLIKSAWIRPEDVAAYEAEGFNHFKLIERGIPSEELLKRVKAYATGEFKGNLAELILPYGFKQPVRKQRFWAIRNFLKPWQINPFRLRKLVDLARQQGMLFPANEQPVVIDNQRLPPDFLDRFRSINCRNSDCSECGYCSAVSSRAVTVRTEFQAESERRLDEIESALAGGGFWNV